MKKHEIVIEYIIRGVQTGNLGLGDYLPSIRTVAKNLGISTSTVFDAYCRLEHDGFVTSKERGGFRLTSISDIPALSVTTEHFPSPISDIQNKHYEKTGRYPQQMVPLGAMSPPNIYFPSEDLSKCLARIARTNPELINNGGLATNFANIIGPIEQITAKHMYKSQGITMPDSEICHTQGALEGLFLALRTITKRDDFVVVESPGFLAVYNMLKQLCLKAVEVEVLPPHGLNIDHLETLLDAGIRPACMVATPNYQNPTGALMPLENRKRLLRLCKKYDIAVIEDDTLGTLRFADKVPTLKELAPEDVVYVSSYSKIMAPGYRVGWVSGGKYAYNIRITQRLDPFVLTIANHLAVAQYIESGKIRVQMSSLRKIYAENCGKMAEALERSFPAGTQVFRPQGGQYIWVTMPENISATSLFFQAQNANILLAPGTLFNGQGKHNNCLRFCFALKMSQDIFDAVEIVGKLAKNEIDEKR
ncbi:MAG: PLP-dependent aminotransferase family protein [Clostridiales Family XIII bacterium]|jgi:DNA-binding transcriptional MocR family regulator|nr:PLP-dependent aminotransferase family protein [Clostridiales Family XIII bacterium]